MLVEYPTSLEREMQTKKSHEIPEAQWGQTPNLQEWIKESKAERDRQQAEMKVTMDLGGLKTTTVSTVPDIFKSLKPNNQDFRIHFSKAQHKVLTDIGVNGNMIVVGLSDGDLVVEFTDPAITIEPHENGMIVDYHQFGVAHTLTDVTSYIPSNSGLRSCLFAFICNNRTFEYVIQPSASAQSLDFFLTFQEHGANDA